MSSGYRISTIANQVAGVLLLQDFKPAVLEALRAASGMASSPIIISLCIFFLSESVCVCVCVCVHQVPL